MPLQLHLWLEETAYFKMPKGQEQELVMAERQSLEKVLSPKCCLPNSELSCFDVLVYLTAHTVLLVLEAYLRPPE